MKSIARNRSTKKSPGRKRGKTNRLKAKLRAKNARRIARVSK
jgi:hypothetical protein